MSYLYVFVDESGNYDFSANGTSHWVLTSLMCTDVTQGVTDLYDLKHRLIDAGIDLEYFHASEDRQVVRDQVFSILAGLGGIRVDSVVVQKCMAAPSIQPLRHFYPMMVENLLKYAFDPRGWNVKEYEKVLVFLDQASKRKKERETLVKALKTGLKSHLGGVPYKICMHRSASHPQLQMVDYFSWAIYQRWERNEQRPYSQVSHHIESQFDIFRYGNKKWY